MMVDLRLRLPWGTLKIKPNNRLRTRELHREVPMFRLGRTYIIWWPKRLDQK